MTVVAQDHFLVKEPHYLSVGTPCCCDAETSATGYFTYQQSHPWWTGFSGASRLDRLGRRTWPPTSAKKIGHENPVTSSGALFDIVPEGERMTQKDPAGFPSAVHRVTRSWNLLHGTYNKAMSIW